MEHLDLAGYLNTPINWNLGAFEQQGECKNDEYIFTLRSLIRSKHFKEYGKYGKDSHR